MKYKHRRRYRKVLRLKRPKFKDLKRFMIIIFSLAGIWLAFFQGIVNTLVKKYVPSETETSDSDIIFSNPLFYFLIFLCLLYMLHRLLNWWFYDRENYLGNVRMLTDEEIKELQAREKIKQN